MDQILQVDGRRLGLLTEPLICADEELGRLQSVRLEWLDGGPMPTSLPVVVALGGSEVPVRRRPVGNSGLRLLVPVVDRPRELELTLSSLDITASVTLQPQREWEIHLIHHSHLDIGYTDPQAIVREQHLEYLDSVLRLARQTDDRDDAAQFRWSEEALWSVTDWLNRRNDQQRREFLERVAEGRISLSAMPFNLHTEMCSTDELYELLRPARELRKRYGLAFRSAMQTDVPGAVAGLPDVLASFGVEHLSVAHNWAGRSHPDGTGALDLPRLFRWQGPAGGSVVVWRTDSPHGNYMEGPVVGLHESYAAACDLFPAYLSSLAKRPYPLGPTTASGWLGTPDQWARPPYAGDVLHLRVHGRFSDNAGPSRTVSDIVQQWNAAWEFPKLRLSTNEDFFDAALDRMGDSLPTHSGDWSDWWAHGVGSAAAPVAVGRQAQATVRDAQSLAVASQILTGAATGGSVADLRRAYQQLALWDEHTWGAANPWKHSDEGSSAGEHQWYWKVARAYEARDEAEQALHRAESTLADQLGSCGTASVYLINTGGHKRTDVSEFFVPASVVGLDHSVRLTDSRDGTELAFDQRIEEHRSRGLGRYLRVLIRDAPAAGLVRLDLTATGRSTGDGSVCDDLDDAPAPADELLLENDHLRVELDQRDGTLCSVIDKSSGRQLINTEAALGFNAYVYDRYATSGHINHNSSKFIDTGNMALLSTRAIGGAVAVIDSGRGAVDSWLQVSSVVPGADRLVTTYRLRHDRPQLEIVNRLTKPRVVDKESAFFAFPFAVEDPRVVAEVSGGLGGPDADRVPGGADYLTTVRHWVAIDQQDGKNQGRAVGWATADAPLTEIGHIALPYVPFPNTMPEHEPATVYSWIHNNIWDTNFPSDQAFEMDFRYTVLFGTGDGAILGARAAESLVQPLRPVITTTPDHAASPDLLSMLEIDDPRVRLVGLTSDGSDTVLIRLICHADRGCAARIRLPENASQAWRATYWGDRLDPLEIADGTVRIDFAGAGAQAIAVTIDDRDRHARTDRHTAAPRQHPSRSSRVKEDRP